MSCCIRNLVLYRTAPMIVDCGADVNGVTIAIPALSRRLCDGSEQNPVQNAVVFFIYYIMDLDNPRVEHYNSSWLDCFCYHHRYSAMPHAFRASIPTGKHIADIFAFGPPAMLHV